MDGQSEYYIAVDEQYKQAIFHKDNPNTPISKWWKYISKQGVIQHQSDYYIAKTHENKYAIFHKDNPQEPLSNWYAEITPEGLVSGTSDYYIAQNDEYKKALFHKDYKEPVINWASSICLVTTMYDYMNPQSFYAVKEAGDVAVQIYCTDDICNPLYSIPDTEYYYPKILYANKQAAVFVIDNHLILYDYMNQEKVVSQEPIKSKINVNLTRLLAPQHINNNYVIPVVCYDKAYLYDLDGSLITILNDPADIDPYISNVLYPSQSMDMIRLY